MKGFRIIFFLWGMMVHFPLLQAEEPVKSMAEFHEKILTVDTHCDTPMALIEEGFDIGKKNRPPLSRVDFPRMKEGGLDAIFFAAFTEQKERTPENTEAARLLAHQMIDSTYAVCEKYNAIAEVAVSSGDAERLERQGKKAIYIGMENGFPLGREIHRITEFYNRGVRYITLCHSQNNEICDSSTGRNGPEHDGLSGFGEKVVREMNRIGMIIDVSHISDDAFYDVIKQSRTPVIASHSSVRSIARHPRNMTDDMIRALAKNGGVIQICLLDDYIKDPDTTSIRFQKEKELRHIYNTTYNSMSDAEKEAVRQQWREIREKYPKQLPDVSDCVDHIDYVRNLVGIDFVGIGSDFDGGGGLADCADVSQFPNITAEMLKRGYSQEEISKVWGGNFFRVFREVEQHAKRRF